MFLATKKHGVMSVTWLTWHSFFLLVKYSDNLLSINICVNLMGLCTVSSECSGLSPPDVGGMVTGNLRVPSPLSLESRLHALQFLAETWEPDVASYSRAHRLVRSEPAVLEKQHVAVFTQACKFIFSL